MFDCTGCGLFIGFVAGSEIGEMQGVQEDGRRRKNGLSLRI